MRGRMGVVAVGLSVVLVFGACTPGGAEPSGSAVSPSVSVTEVSTPTPSSDPEMDALYAEAEQVFLRSLELRWAYELRGDFSEFPPELYELLADPYLASALALYDFAKEKNWHGPEGAEPTISVVPYPDATYEEAEVTLLACMDTRPTPALDSTGQVVSEGSVFRLELFFKHVDGALKLFHGNSREVSECTVG